MYTTDAIVLKKVDVGEHDALYMLYTREYGKMRAVAAGIKKPEAKLRGHLETLALSRIRFISGKNREKLIGAILVNFWPRMRASGETLAAGHYIARRIDQECMEGQKDEVLWDLLERSFFTLDSQGVVSAGENLFIRNFEDDLRSVLGYGRAGDPGYAENSSGMQGQEYAIISAWQNWKN